VYDDTIAVDPSVRLDLLLRWLSVADNGHFVRKFGIDDVVQIEHFS
jgi:hypothetical protein